MLSTNKTGPIRLHLRNAITEDAVKKPYKIPTSLQAPQDNGYFVLQYKIKDISDEEQLQLETDYKMDGKNAVAISQKEEKVILDKLEKGFKKLEAELKKGDEKKFKIIAPLSDDGWLLKSSKTKAQLEKIDSVYFVDVFHPAFKLTTTLFEKITKPTKTSGSKSQQSDKIGIVLSLFPDADIKVIESMIRSVKGDCKVVEHIGFDQGKQIKLKVVAAVIPESALTQVAQLPDVHLIEETAIPGMTLTEAHVNTGVNTAAVTMAAIMPAPPALDGNGQTIGIYDTGVDNGNNAALVADLNGRVVGDIANWTSAAAQSWSDRMYDGQGVLVPGHGTSVTGIAVGNGAISGVAPGANAVIRPWSADFNPAWPVAPMTFDVTRALTNAYGQGARIHNNSWGETQGINFNQLVFFRNQYRISDERIDTYTRANPQMLVVTSAGNEGGGGANTITSPGTGKNVLTVGSSGNGNPAAGNNAVAGTAVNAVAASSSRGPATFNRLKPDVVTPGDKIAAIRPQANNPGPRVHNAHNAYEYGGGTSFAAPYVSGMSALIRQFLGDNTFHNGNNAIRQRVNPSGMLVKALIVNGAQRLNPNGAHIPNNNEGYGLVNLDQSINPDRLKLVYDSGDATEPNNGGNAFSLRRWRDTEKTFDLDNLNNNPLSITLVWYDIIDGGGTGALACDLDLILRKTDNGNIYRGGVPGFVNGETRLLDTRVLKRNSGLRDNTNTVEKIYIAAPVAGNYTVRVKTRTIPSVGFFDDAIRVPFALVVAQD